VVLIGRPQHVEVIKRQGLRLETQTFDERIRVSASTEASAVQGAQLVLFCVKSTDTESGAAAIKPHLETDALVLSLQNGVEDSDRLPSGRGDISHALSPSCTKGYLKRILSLVRTSRIPP
jgi:2-dehydropantoate 2-reductase